MQWIKAVPLTASERMPQKHSHPLTVGSRCCPEERHPSLHPSLANSCGHSQVLLGAGEKMAGEQVHCEAVMEETEP